MLTLEVDPASVELVDSMILRQARANLEYSRMMGFLEGDPEAVLLVELTGTRRPRPPRSSTPWSAS